MPFSIPLAAANYLTIWFVVLFAVLPFGISVGIFAAVAALAKYAG